MKHAVRGERRKAGPVPHPRRVAIVGNAPEMADQSARIDGADWIVRFNNTAGFGSGAGRRVTHLALLNHGGQMREWLEDPTFVRRPCVQSAGAFLFPFAPKLAANATPDEHGRCWTREAEAMLAPLGAPVAVLPEAVHREAAAILVAAAQPGAVPSTGFLVALHLAGALLPSVEIGIHGFGFTGWHGHAWDIERRWFESMAATGRFRLHALDARLTA